MSPFQEHNNNNKKAPVIVVERNPLTYEISSANGYAKLVRVQEWNDFCTAAINTAGKIFIINLIKFLN